MKKLLFILVLALSFLLTACNVSSGSSADGQELFSQSAIGSQAGCSTCHSVEPGVVVIGPSVAGIGTRAGTLVTGQSAADYLKESITDPDAYVAEGFPASIMPQGYAQELTSEQVDQLVAYMLTLK